MTPTHDRKNPMRGTRIFRGFVLAFFAAIGLAPTAQAQIQRSFLNSGFETPVLPAGCAYWIPEQFIPGWNTTETTTGSTVFGGCTIPPALTTPGPVIEVWTTNFNGVAAGTGAGNQYAELNANSAATQYQTVCLINGETGNFDFLHRGRSSNTVADVMDFQVRDTGNALVQQIVRVSTTANGTVTAPVAGAGTVLGADSAAGNGWRRYTGTFVYSGAGGSRRLALSAVSAAGGLTSGNFIDEFVVTLRPVIEFETASSVGRESSIANLPRFNVSGTVPAGGLTVLVSVTGGTATLGTDYTTPTGLAAFTMVIPAGNYDGVTGSTFALPVSVTNDAIIENNKTITFGLTASAAYNISSIAACGGAGRTASAYTIVDDDIDLKVTKTVNVAAGGLGAASVFTLTYSNVTPAVLTLAPLTGHDVGTVAVTDTPSAGLVIGPWTCAATGGATCPAASGSGALPTAAILPVGGVLTYAVNGTLPTAASSCQTLASNAATISATASGTASDPLTEGTSVQGNAGYVFQPNAASANVAVLCPVKTVSVLTDLAPTGPSSGDTLRYSLTYSLPVGATALGAFQITDTLPAGLGFASLGVTGATANGGYAGSGNLLAAAQPLAAGGSITANINATVAANVLGNLDNQASATATGLGAALATDNDGGTIPGDAIAQPEDGTAAPDITRIRVVASADVQITKTDGKAAAIAGTVNTYTLVVTNVGPSAANNAVLTDALVAGLNVTAVACTGATGGAVCPATVTVALLQGAGIVIPTLPLGATVTFTVTSTVTATGL
jgi:uncharacterized repeat protein (TIGR01451 family)/fimbrial isopeptide formation D2 family protein